MLEFRCADSGTVCPDLLHAFTREELHRQVTDHLRRRHRVKTPTRTITNYLEGLARTVDEPTSDKKARR